MTERIYSDFLTAEGSLVTGAGSLFCLGGNYFRYHGAETGALADAQAILQDFGMIGQDLGDVADSLRQAGSKQLKLPL